VVKNVWLVIDYLKNGEVEKIKKIEKIKEKTKLAIIENSQFLPYEK
jgi:hypothetical protein